jgi:hypothetical protein
VKEVRERHPLLPNQDALAKRMEELGQPIDRSTIGRIENGNRSVTVDELFVLAAALDVAPMQLVVPLDSEELVAVTPTERWSAGAVRRWFTGAAILGGLVKSRRIYQTEVDDVRLGIDKSQWVDGEPPPEFIQYRESVPVIEREEVNDGER